MNLDTYHFTINGQEFIHREEKLYKRKKGFHMESHIIEPYPGKWEYFTGCNIMEAQLIAYNYTKAD